MKYTEKKFPGLVVTLLLMVVTVCLYFLVFWDSLKVNEESEHFAVPVSSPKGESDRSGQPFFYENFITAEGNNQVHVASITAFKDGQLAAVWYGGKHEGSKDTLVFLSTCSWKQGKENHWTKPRGIVGRRSAGKQLKRYIKKVGNPLIFTDSRDRLWLLYVTVSFGGWSGSALNVQVSEDRGETWSPTHRLTLSPFFNVSTLVRNCPVFLTDGRIGIPIYHECLGIFSEMLWISRDESDGSFDYVKTRMTWGNEFLQPAVAPIGPRRAIVLYRNHQPGSEIKMAETTDRGISWSRPTAINLPNPAAGLNAVTLWNNRVLLAYNDSLENRENLSLALWEPQTKKWRRIAVLENTKNGEFSYPYMTKTKNGTIHLVYTWQRKRIKHVVFNEAWVGSPSGGPPGAPVRRAPRGGAPWTPYCTALGGLRCFGEALPLLWGGDVD